MKVLFVTPSGVEAWNAESELPHEIGSKAGGLLRLPAEWVPPFFVVSPEFFDAFRRAEESQRGETFRAALRLLESALDETDLRDVPLLLRSNALSETIGERGRFASVDATASGIEDGLLAFCNANIEAASEEERLGIIVQRRVIATLKGHLSNERRVAEEYRDAEAEIEDPASGLVFSTRIATRRWRESRLPTLDPLFCRRQSEVLAVLHEPLTFASNLRQRFHFEWVWDGGFVYLVQADSAGEARRGVDPSQLSSGAARPAAADQLQFFEVATRASAESFPKVRNHFEYQERGFPQPTFYLLRQAAAIQEILEGRLPSPLEQDLEKLTRFPLVLRTASRDSSFTMLPRSDEIYGAAEAREWLLGPFRAEIIRIGATPSSIALLAHHYLPALASAFSAARPGDREVIIEALWGIPEGLYYFACDEFSVDTLEPELPRISAADTVRFRIERDIQYKGNFVAPDETGRFVVHPTAPPWDWKPVIQDDESLGMMALLTRQLADASGKPTKVMWFLGCKGDGLPSILPWYHDFEVASKSELKYRQRNRRDEEFSVRTQSDLEALEARATRDERPSNGGVLVVRVDPAEDRIIRNRDFADRLGAAARRLDAIIEFQGGSLAHVYYALQRSGARISVRRKQKRRVRVESQEKLVRDRIPEVVAKKGEVARVTRLSAAEMRAALKVKLVEEAFEARDSGPAELQAELADVLEVVSALRETLGLTAEELEEIRERKRAQRGGFDEGIVLRETSLGEQPEVEGLFGEAEAEPGRILEVPSQPQLEAGVLDQTFDVRRSSGATEYVQRADVGLSIPSWEVRSPKGLRFGPTSEPIEWTLEGTRASGARLRLAVRIRIGSSQLVLRFS